MTYRIVNWDKWQSYRRDRGQPPWIKIHRPLMRDPNWIGLTDAQRGQLVSIWLLAADKDGVIPADESLISKLCFMSGKLSMQVFIDKGFTTLDDNMTTNTANHDAMLPPDGCQRDANVTPERRQYDAPDKRREEAYKETEKEKRQKGEFSPPTLGEVEAYCKEKSLSVDPKQFFDFFTVGSWVDSNGNQVRNWKQKLLTWESKGNGRGKPIRTSNVSVQPSSGPSPYAGLGVTINSV